MKLNQDLLAAAEVAEFAAEAQTAEQQMAAMTQVLQYQRAIQIGLTAARMNRLGNAPANNERLPLLDDGHEFGRVAARIPEDLFWTLYHQRDFGREGLFSEDGLKDVLRDFPMCRVKTVSGKITVGYGSGSRGGRWGTRRRVKFDTKTNFAT